MHTDQLLFVEPRTKSSANFYNGHFPCNETSRLHILPPFGLQGAYPPQGEASDTATSPAILYDTPFVGHGVSLFPIIETYTASLSPLTTILLRDTRIG